MVTSIEVEASQIFDSRGNRTVEPLEIQWPPFQLIEGTRNDQSNDSNLYWGHMKTKSGDIQVTYHCHPEGNEDLQYWHDKGLMFSHANVLRVHARAKCKEVGKEILITERIEESLGSWVTRHPLLDQNLPDTLDPLFRNYLKHVLEGMIYLRFIEDHPHGEICEANIFVGRQIAKLANILDPKKYSSKSFGDDMDKFCGMIRRLFKQKGAKIPLELEKFCTSLQQNKEFDSYFKNAIYHPALLGPKDRCDYRHKAWSRIRGDKLKPQVERKLTDNLKAANMFCHWIRKIKACKVQDYVDVLTYHDPAGKYIENSLEFLRFGRNSNEHIERKDGFTDEVIDCDLNSFFPGFLGALQDVLLQEGILVLV